MFVVGDVGDDINEYDCTAFDVSTCVVDAGLPFDVSGEDTLPDDVAFSADGTKMFVVGQVGQSVYEYACGTAFDVSTCVVDAGLPFDVSGEETTPWGLEFSADGTKMFVVGDDSGSVHEYDCTAFDVSTCSFTDSFDVSGKETSTDDVVFSTDGLTMFIIGEDSDAVHEYALGIAYDLSSVPTFFGDFKCWINSESQNNSPSTIQLEITDQFNQGGPPIVNNLWFPNDYCAAAEKNGQPSPFSPDLNQHYQLWFYPPSFEGPEIDVTVNLEIPQFDDLNGIVIGNLDYIMVPATKDTGSGPQDSIDDQQHWNCYDLEFSNPPLPAPTNDFVTLVTQHFEQEADVLRPFVLCAPMIKFDGNNFFPDNQELIDEHMVCYDLENVTIENTFENLPNTLIDQLGSNAFVANDVEALCVTAFKSFPQLNPGDIIVADIGANAVIKVDPTTGAQEIISSGGLFAGALDLVLDSNGDIIVADLDLINGGGSVIKVDPITRIQTVISTGDTFVNPNGVVVAANGDIFVSDFDGFEESQIGRITKVDPTTGAQTIISSGGSLFVTTGITIDSNGDILVTDLNNIISVDPITGMQTIISSDGLFEDIIDLTIDANGDILVADGVLFEVPGTGSIIKVDPDTGVQEIISTGGIFVSPNGVAVAANGDIIVADFETFGGTGKIIKVDPITGAQTIISSGGLFVDPAGIFIVPELCIPPSSGDWTVTADCTMTASDTINNGDLIVQSNAVLTIPSGVTLTIDFTTHNISIQSGSGVKIVSGGKIN